MSQDDPLLEQIVSSVLAQLAARTDTGASEPAELLDCTKRSQQTQNQPVVLSEPVITEAVLKERLGKARNLTIARRAVVTPSAVDYLKTQNITWSRETDQGEREISSNGWLTIGVEATPAVRRLVQDIERSSGKGGRTEQSGSVEGAVSVAVSALCRDRTERVIVFAEAAEWVACLANRNERIRAAVVDSQSHIDRLRTSLAPNLWIINPAGRTDGALRDLWKHLNLHGA